MDKRSGAIDALRIIGIVAIVAGHTWDNGPIRAGLYTWHVPLFFFLTGFLWTRNRPLRDESVKRSRTLLIPYAVWLVVIGVLFEAWLYLRGDFQPAHLMNLLWGGNHLGRPFSAFWFVTALFLAVIALRVLQRLPMWFVCLFALAGLGAAHTIGPQLADLPLSVGVAWPALVFVLAGYGFRKIRPRITAPVPVGAASLGAGVVFAVTGVASSFNIKQANFGTPVLSVLMALLISAGMLLLADALFSRLNTTTNTSATVLAMGGFMVVLTHAVPLWVLGVGGEGSLLGFAAALVGPWAVALLIGKTPFAPYLLGSSPQNPAAKATVL